MMAWIGAQSGRAETDRLARSGLTVDPALVGGQFEDGAAIENQAGQADSVELVDHVPHSAFVGLDRLHGHRTLFPPAEASSIVWRL